MASGKKTGGRRKGTQNKATTKALALQAVAEKLGVTPLDIMLENMRHFQMAAHSAEAVLEGLTAEDLQSRTMEPAEQFKALLAEVKKVAGLRQMAQECARDAAPYLHHRLASVVHTGKDGGPIQYTKLERTIVDPIHTNGKGIPAASDGGAL
jgi:hypothetical protein